MLKFRCLLFVISLLAPSLGSAQTARQEAGNLVMESIPPIPASILEKLDLYQDARSARLCDWAPGGSGLLIATRFGETAQIHYVKEPGGCRQQLTFRNEPVSRAETSPASGLKGFMYVMDSGGNEKYQFYYYDMSSGSSRLLTDGKSRHGSFVWSSSGKEFAYTGNQRDPKAMDIWMGSLDGSLNKMVYQVEGNGWGIMDLSGDGKLMLLLKYISVNESKLYLLNTADNTVTPVNESGKQVAYSAGKFSKDGKGFYFVSDEDTEFRQLRYCDIATKKITSLAPGIDWDIEDMEISPDGKSLAFVTNEDGRSKLYLFNTKSRKYSEIKEAPQGIISSVKFHPQGRHLAFSISTSTTPGDVYTIELPKNKLTRWTWSEVGGLNTSRFSQPELIRYPTFDSVDGKPRTIPAVMYKPKNATGKVPVVINIHGGPAGQTRPGFNPVYQYMTSEMGIGVIAPNVRGSTGYGKTFMKLDNGYLREDAVKDIGMLLDWIAQQPDLDAERVAVWGGSYGGYMTLACMTHYSSKLKAGIDVVGISNFITFLNNTGDYRRDLRRVEYGDERDPNMQEFLLKISPTSNVNKITRPMFIVQGLNDPRVPVSEAEQMLEALKKNGNTAWYLMAKDEGHGFSKKSNRDFYTSALMLFLENYVMKQ